MKDTSHLQQLIINKRRRLQKLQETQALYGINTPPEIAIEIEDLQREIEALSTQLVIEIDPQSFNIVVNKLVHQAITLKNCLTASIRHVELTLQAGWPVTVKQTKLALDDLAPGEERSISVALKIEGEIGQTYRLPIRIRADQYPVWIATLEIVTITVPEPAPEATAKKAEQKLPSIREFQGELLKLTDQQFIDLSYDPVFRDLADTLRDPLLTPRRKVDKILEFCENRRKFPDLHRLLPEILGSVYRFSGQDSVQ